MEQKYNDYQKTVPSLMKYARRLCGNEEGAVRLVDDTLSCAYQKAWKKPVHLTPENWLPMMMAQQHALNPVAYTQHDHGYFPEGAFRPLMCAHTGSGALYA